MKIFTFLKKEKADIEVVDRKLEKFEKIFDGTVEMSKAAKMEFELLKQRLTGVVSRLSCLYLDPLFWVCVDEQKVKSQVLAL
jgi:ribosome-binding ATPase YchF (GTP1/OBG family)